MADKVVDRRDKGWYWIDNKVLDEYGPTLGPYGIAVYNLLVRRADANGECYPTLQEIADRFGIGKPKVIAMIRLLVELHFIRVEHRKDQAGDPTSNLYTLLNVRGGNPRLPPTEEKAPEAVTDDYRGGNPRLLKEYSINNTQPEQEKLPIEDEPEGEIHDPLWLTCLAHLSLQMTKGTFETWLRGTTAVRAADRLLVTVHNDSAADWLDRRLRPTVERAVAAIYGEAMKIEFRSQEPESSILDSGSCILDSSPEAP